MYSTIRRPKRGMILFIVTIVVAMLAVGSLALVSLFTTEYEATMLRGDEIQAGQLVQSGIEWIAVTVDSPEADTTVEAADLLVGDDLSRPNGVKFETGNPLYDSPDRFRGVEVVPSEFGPYRRGAGRFTVFSPRIERERHQGIRYGLVNESARLHLGAVLEWELESPGQGTRALMKLPGMTPSVADSILDWIDADKQPRPSGAELEYYQRMGVPYLPRNDVPVTLEELLLVRDVTRALLFGNDESFSYGAKMTDLQLMQASVDSQNDLLFQPLDPTNELTPTEMTATTITATEILPTDPNAPEPATETIDTSVHDFVDTSAISGENALPWCFLLTTLSAEKLVDPNGEAKVFLNDKNLEFLEEQLTGFVDEQAAKFVVAWRKNNGDIEDPLDLLDAEVTDKETSEVTKSPFSLENSAAEERFLKLLDHATASTEVVVSGRINVNEAPRVVLEAVPELTSPMVQQIVNRRGSPSEKKQGKYRHTVWLLSEKIVDKEQMKKLSKRLTTGGDVYRAQVVGFYDDQGTVSRAEIVVDATVKPPRQIFSKDLTMFGSGFD